LRAKVVQISTLQTILCYYFTFPCQLQAKYESKETVSQETKEQIIQKMNNLLF